MKINLIYKQEKYKKIEKRFALIRQLIILFGVLTITILLFIFYMTTSQNNIENNLQLEKKILIQNSIQKKEIEQKIDFVDKKGEVIKKAQKDQVPFNAYYDMLSPYLSSQSTASAVLGNINISEDKILKFSKNYPSYEELLSNINVFESERFTSLFEEASIDRIKFGSEKNKSFSLSFQGKLKPLIQIQ